MANRLWGIPQRWTCVEGLISCDCDEDDGCEVCCGLVNEVWNEGPGMWRVWHYGCGAYPMGFFPCARSAWDFYRIEHGTIPEGNFPDKWNTPHSKEIAFWNGPREVCGRFYLFARHAIGGIMWHTDRWICVYDSCEQVAA